MGVSERQAWRILAAYRKEGAAALAHENHSRKPRNAVSGTEADAVVMLASTDYAGANHTHLSELLRDREGIDLSRQTVPPHPDEGRHPQPREATSSPAPGAPHRVPQAGMLVQIDGSHHPWLEERGPRFVLLPAVDYATGIVVNAVFRPEEDTRGYFILMRGLIKRWGVPLALYCDRHGTFRFSGRPRHISRR